MFVQVSPLIIVSFISIYYNTIDYILFISYNSLAKVNEIWQI